MDCSLESIDSLSHGEYALILLPIAVWMASCSTKGRVRVVHIQSGGQYGRRLYDARQRHHHSGTMHLKTATASPMSRWQQCHQPSGGSVRGLHRPDTVVIPNSVTSIAGYAFNYCTSLTMSRLAQCRLIGAGAFESCSSLAPSRSRQASA